jgi:V8-like Glu-specific endopeptidase
VHPYSCIGLIKFIQENGATKREGFGTGFLIAEDLVLTVAHNLYMRGHSKPAFTNIRFFPGVNGQLLHNKVETAESIKVVDYKFHESFKTALDKDHTHCSSWRGRSTFQST